MTSSTITGSSVTGGNSGWSFESIISLVGAAATAIGSTVAAAKGTTTQTQQQVAGVTGPASGGLTTLGANLNPGSSFLATLGSVPTIVWVGGALLLGIGVYLAIRKG